MARLRQIDGDAAGALDLLAQAERVYDTDFSPDVQPIPAVRARLWLTQGRLDDALAWVREQGLAVDDELELPPRVPAHHPRPALLAGTRPQRSRPALRRGDELLDRLLRAAEDGGRGGSVIEILVLQALALQARRGRPGRAGVAAPRARAGRAGGLRADLRGRGPADGRPAARGGEAGERSGLRAPPAGRARHAGGHRPRATRG